MLPTRCCRVFICRYRSSSVMFSPKPCQCITLMTVLNHRLGKCFRSGFGFDRYKQMKMPGRGRNRENMNNSGENTSKCRKKPALQYCRRPDVRDRHNGCLLGPATVCSTQYPVPSPCDMKRSKCIWNI